MVGAQVALLAVHLRLGVVDGGAGVVAIAERGAAREWWVRSEGGFASGFSGASASVVTTPPSAPKSPFISSSVMRSA